MKIKNTLLPLIILLLVIIAFSSCEEDFELVANEIVGDIDNDAQLDETPTVIAYSKKLLPVQTNNLPEYQLGVYNDPIFGKYTASLVSQLKIKTNDPQFGDLDENYPVSLDSVFLYIPYFSEETITDEDLREYSLDSVFGNQPIKLSIYESLYFLRSIDPETNFEESQKYYSDFKSTFKDPVSGLPTEFVGELLYQDNELTPSNQGYILTKDSEEIDSLQYLSPGIRVALPINFFEEKIINQQGTPELLNNNNFTEYFRGLFFDIEDNDENGNLTIFDFENANITLSYSFQRPRVDTSGDPVIDTEDIDNDGDTTEQIIDLINEDFLLDFSGINVNLFNNENQLELPEPDTINGEENLYLKGADGFITVINLFGNEDLIHFEGDTEVSGSNDIPDELDRLRQKKWLINEANLIFYVNQDLIQGGETEPERIIIYDINNNTVLVDYGLDSSTAIEPVDAKTEHLGRLQRDSDGLGTYYKIKITNHVSNLINKDSTNVSLGLMISQNVNRGGFQVLKEAQEPNLKEVPSAGVIAPEGTVLYGNATSNEEKRLKLQIYYTEPN
ncbi:MAG: DUF4270 domain-containing protein [Flavobacteriales bacterium]